MCLAVFNFINLEENMFNALVVEKNEKGTEASVQEISYDELPVGEVTVSFDYSAVNYKDGLCIG